MATVPSSGGEKPPDQSQNNPNPKANKPQLGAPLISNTDASDLLFGDAITVGIFQHHSCSEFAIRSHGVCSPHQNLSLRQNSVRDSKRAAPNLKNGIAFTVANDSGLAVIE